MTVFFPEATPVLGNVKTKAVLTIATPGSLAIATEYNAASSLDLSCFIRPMNPQATSNSGSAPDRSCGTITLPQEGRTVLSAFDLRYIYDPQAISSDNDNKARTLLVKGTVLWLVIRKGLDALTTAAAAGQQYEAWKVRLGRQNDTQSGDDEYAEFEVSQMAFPVQDVVKGTFAA